MGKASRSKVQSAEKKQRQEEKRRQEKRKKRIEATIALSCVGAIVLAVGGVFAANKIKENYLDSGEGLRKVIALSTDNFQVDNAMMTYYTYNDYYYYVNYYGDNAETYGIDTDLALSEQMYNDSTGQSWLDYCREEARENLEAMLVLCEEAKKNNVSLSEEDNEEISKMLETVTPTDYGRGVNAEDIRKSLEITYLATKYQDIVKGEIEITDDEIETYYNENKNSYNTGKYVSWDIGFVDPDDQDEEGISEEEAKAYADTLKACTSLEEFKAAITDYLKAIDPDISEHDLTTQLAKLTDRTVTYTAEKDIPEWAFKEARQVGDTMSELDEDNDKYTVYMLTTVPARNETNVIDVRHILFNFDDYETEDAAKADAEKILEDYNSGEKTEDSFAALAMEYSTDGSASNGGLYEGVYVGQMVENFENWCFDEARKTGDVDIVKTEYGYHIMYFVKHGEAKYKYDIRDVLETEEYNEIYADIKANNTITVNEEVLSEVI